MHPSLLLLFLCLYPLAAASSPSSPLTRAEKGVDQERTLEKFHSLAEDRLKPGDESSSLLSGGRRSSASKKKDLSKEERSARRQLRKKKRRLRQLREEIRRITGSAAGGAGGGAVAAMRAGPGGRAGAGAGTDASAAKWRRRLLARLDSITARLERMEALILESGSGGGASKKEAENARRMDRHFASSIARSLNGEAGGACASHRDCRPGRCCHRQPQAAAGAAAAAAAAPAAVCVRHDLQPGAAGGCADACQCTLQLQCFAPRAGGNGTVSSCKRADSTDILTGTYLNDASGIF